MLVIEPSTFRCLEAADAWEPLIAEYGAEAGVHGMPPPSVKREQYHALEDNGLIHVFRARVDGELVGYIIVLATAMPHYAGVQLAVSESFFVRRAFRHTGAGLKLLRAAEDKAAALNCLGLIVSAPSQGTLAEVLPRRGFRETNKIFFKPVRQVAHA